MVAAIRLPYLQPMSPSGVPTISSMPLAAVTVVSRLNQATPGLSTLVLMSTVRQELPAMAVRLVRCLAVAITRAIAVVLTQRWHSKAAVR